MTLTTNRYGVVTPAQIFTTGVTVSTPIYININQEIAKTILNQFRVKKQQELLAKGYEKQYQSNSVSVQTTTLLPMTDLEAQLGMNEESLRSLLFGRSGIPERTILKLQQLLDMEVVTKEQILDTAHQWISHLYGHEDSLRDSKESKTTKAKPKTTKTTSTK